MLLQMELAGIGKEPCEEFPSHNFDKELRSHLSLVDVPKLLKLHVFCWSFFTKSARCLLEFSSTPPLLIQIVSSLWVGSDHVIEISYMILECSLHENCFPLDYSDPKKKSLLVT